MHPAAPATLRVLFSGGRLGGPTPFRVTDALTEIGRAPGHGRLVLPDDPRVSRAHASITFDAATRTLRVVDRSTHGTWIGLNRVPEGVARDGDVIRVGDSFLSFRAEDDLGIDAAIDGLIGVAPSTRRLRSVLALVGPTSATTLLVGETGTGKEVAARALHASSGRDGPFVAVNCSAIPESLAESALFGHVPGAFTGARGRAEGLFRSANRGTILLDEIGELPAPLQPKLLRALEERVVTPVGSTRSVGFDARVVAATNVDLVRAIKAGRFRPDLYARLAEMVIELPPLRARREDILLLLSRALAPDTELHPDLVAALLQHEWPFNVRELLKVASAMQIRARGKREIDTAALDDRFHSPSDSPPLPTEPSVPPTRRARPGRAQLETLLRTHAGMVTEVARATGHSRRQVHRWLRKYGIDPERYREAE